MKEKDIALFNNTLVRIEKIEYKEKKKKIKIGGNLFNPIYKKELIKEVDKVWWRRVGDNTNRIESYDFGTQYYEWDKMISNANLLINQVNLL